MNAEVIKNAKYWTVAASPLVWKCLIFSVSVRRSTWVFCATETKSLFVCSFIFLLYSELVLSPERPRLLSLLFSLFLSINGHWYSIKHAVVQSMTNGNKRRSVQCSLIHLPAENNVNTINYSYILIIQNKYILHIHYVYICWSRQSG